jgi:hypothetical protein
VPRCWFVERDPRNTGQRHRLGNGDHADHGTVPLDRLPAGLVVDLT